jgi:ABC-type branched-subunit amino acid transport system ATPase component
VFDGKDITDWQTAKIMREAVAIVPKGVAFSRMTVEENLGNGGFADRDQYQTRIKRVYELSRGCGTPHSAQAPCLAVNSRCWRLARR